MDYVTLSGVCKQIVAKESDLAVFILGQALDSTESYASATATSVPGSYGVTTITNIIVHCKHHCLHAKGSQS